jgi:hypothetical protein
MVNGPLDISKGVSGGCNKSNHCVKRHISKSNPTRETKWGYKGDKKEINSPENNQMV